jgi:hypothetical protein
MKIPAKGVKIGYTWYDFEHWSRQKAVRESAYGNFEHFHGRQRIGLAKHKKGSELANTLLHEILHGIAYQYGLCEDFSISDKTCKVEEGSHEEKIVNAFSNGLMAVMVDNPWIMDWIQDRIDQDKYARKRLKLPSAKARKTRKRNHSRKKR